MPKEILEVKNFNKGVITNAAGADLPDTSAQYSLNVDPKIEFGKIGGIPDDSTAVSGVSATSMVSLNDAGTYKTYMIDSASSGDKKFKYIDNIQDYPDGAPTVNTISETAEALTVTPVGQSKNKEVHFGMGNAPAMWVGDITDGQFGGEPPGISAVAANLDFPQAAGRSRDVYYDIPNTNYYTMNYHNGIDKIDSSGDVTENFVSIADTKFYRMCPTVQTTGGAWDVIILAYNEAASQVRFIYYDFSTGDIQQNALEDGDETNFDVTEVTQMIEDPSVKAVWLYSNPNQHGNSEYMYVHKPTFLWKTANGIEADTDPVPITDVKWLWENHGVPCRTDGSGGTIGQFWVDRPVWWALETAANGLEGEELYDNPKTIWSFFNGTVKFFVRGNGNIHSFKVTDNLWEYVDTMDMGYDWEGAGGGARCILAANENDGVFIYRAGSIDWKLAKVSSAGVLSVSFTGIDTLAYQGWRSPQPDTHESAAFHTSNTKFTWIGRHDDGGGYPGMHYPMEMSYTVAGGITSMTYRYLGLPYEDSIVYVDDGANKQFAITAGIGGHWGVYAIEGFGDSSWWYPMTATTGIPPTIEGLPLAYGQEHRQKFWPLGDQTSTVAQFGGIGMIPVLEDYAFSAYRIERPSMDSADCQFTRVYHDAMNMNSHHYDVTFRDTNNLDIIEFPKYIQSSSSVAYMYTMHGETSGASFQKQNNANVTEEGSNLLRKNFAGNWDLADRMGMAGYWNPADDGAWVCVIPTDGDTSTHLVKTEMSAVSMSDRPLFVNINSGSSTTYTMGITLRIDSDTRVRQLTASDDFSTEWRTNKAPARDFDDLIFLFTSEGLHDEIIGDDAAKTKFLEPDTDMYLDEVDFILGGIEADRYLQRTSGGALVTSVDVSCTFADNSSSSNDTIVRHASDWEATDYYPGQFIVVTGTSNNNGTYIIESISETSAANDTITITESGTLTDEATVTCTVAQMLSPAFIRYSFTESGSRKLFYLNDSNLNGYANFYKIPVSSTDLPTNEHSSRLMAIGQSGGKIFLANETVKGHFQHYYITPDANLRKYIVHATQIINIVATENNDVSTFFLDDTKYFYKASFIFDGYQEGPLCHEFTATNTDGGPTVGENFSVAITLKNVATALSPRITHVNIYRAAGESAVVGAENPLGFYRLVKTLPLDTAWTSTGTGLVNKIITITDQGDEHETYEANSGLSENLGSTTLNYSMSTQLNDHHFISGAYMGEKVEDATSYVFKSMPGNFDQFDWSRDLLRLPSAPTAIQAFNGRIYAWDENNTYRIEPNEMYIEDIFEGVGCLNKNAVAVTEYGMCFADKNNIYLHDGVKPKAIGNAILKAGSDNDLIGDRFGWQTPTVFDERYGDGDKTNYTRVLFDATRNAYMISFRTSLDTFFWVYSLEQNRWDTWRADIATSSPGYGSDIGFGDEKYNITGAVTGKNGEIFLCNGGSTGITHFMGGDGYRAWDWLSKEFTMGYDTQTKKLISIKTTGTDLAVPASFPWVIFDGNLTTSLGWEGDLSSLKVPSNLRNFNKVSFLYLIATGKLDSYSFIYRRRPLK